MTEFIPFPTRSAVPPDDAARRRALDPAQSFLVQAPAGSGKTHLLTQRFLRLLAQAQRPDEIVAITFTIAAAAEMRQRILEALEKAEAEEKEGAQQDFNTEEPAHDPLSIPALARAALLHSRQMHWQLLDQPGQLRVLTIDAFCRALAMQAPLNWGLLSGLASLETTSQPKELYRRAGRRLFERALDAPSPARISLEALLLWRDNNWPDIETQIVEMLAQRNRWRQDFVFTRDLDFDLLRQRLEAPMRRAAHRALAHLSAALDVDPAFREEILTLARATCENPGENSPFPLAECTELPAVAHADALLEPFALEDAISLFRALACFLLTAEGAWRKSGGLNAKLGFPPGKDGQPLKARMGRL
ncbi:MAG TPA: UvrD-helicase domain-containing protein, partial [Acidobacteriaceae bacterium]|nr:UvrD-helicase domain-containing protein [Acidobacteriaceae bacterium]